MAMGDKTTGCHLNRQFFFVLAIIGFLLIFLSLVVVALTPQAHSFEFSIYDAFPWPFWAIIVATQFIAILIIICATLDGRFRGYWKFGFLMLIITDLVLLCLPFTRGYVINGSEDVLSHIGWMRDILNTGHLGSSNPYPYDHILGTMLSYVSGLGLPSVTFIIPPTFSLLFIISFASLAKRILTGGSVLYAIAFSSIMMFGMFQILFAPNHQTFLLFPLLLYLYFRVCNSNQRAFFSITLLIMLIALVFYHPLNTILFILVLGGISLSYYVNKRNCTDESIQIKPPTTLTAIVLVVFFSWSAYVSMFSQNAYRVIQTITGGFSGSAYSSYSSTILSSNPEIVDLAVLVFSKYGQWIIMGALALISIYFFRKKGVLSEDQWIIARLSSVEFLIFSVLTGIFLITFYVDISRVFSIGTIFAIIIFSLFLNFNISRAKSKRHRLAIISVVSIIVLALLSISVLNLYASPINNKINDQVTMTEIYGAKHYFSTRNSSMSNIELGISIYRFYNLNYGSSTDRENIDYSGNLPVEHFGWPSNVSLADAYNGPYYMMILPQGEFFYENLYPNYAELWKFNPNDFSRLQTDLGVMRIYCNSGLTTYYVGQ